MQKAISVLFFFISLVSFGQSAATLTGGVYDANSHLPVELASVVIKNSDSSYVNNSLTNEKGQFTFQKMAPGKYFLEVSFLGYDKYSSSYIDFKTFFSLPAIQLNKNNTTLKEVNISAIKNAIEFKPGKTVYTISKDQTNIGLNGLEVLKKIPGVFIDNDDKITVRGKSGIRVFIDDRPSALAAENPAEAIKFFPAGSIESIEVITNPGAKYDAAGSGAIINVKLKKEKKLGMNGNASLGIGSRYEFSGVNKYSGGVNANIRRNKTNVFINSNLRYDQRQMKSQNQRSQNGQTMLTDVDGTTQSSNAFIKTGIDYFINDKNTFGCSYMYGLSQYNNSSKSLSKNNFYLPATNSNSGTDGNYNSQTMNLNYVLKTKRAGEELSFDITQSKYKRANLDSIRTVFDLPLLLIERQYSKTGGYASSNVLQVDYSRTLKGDGKFECGIKNSYTGNRSDFNFYKNEKVGWNLDSSRSNAFDYFENVAAAYGQYSNKYKKWEYELGLRGEFTKVSSNISDVNQNYINLFPDLQMSKKFEENRTFSTSYSRRIDRVPFNMLNNSVSYSDRYVGNRGNPKLLPAISNTLSLDFQKQFEGGNDFNIGGSGFSLYGAFTKNSSTYAVLTDTSQITYVSYVNILHTWSYGADAYIQASYKRWYSATLSISGNYNYFNDVSHGAGYNLYMQNNFKFKKKHSININGYCYSKFRTPQGYMNGNYQLNAGYRYVFWKENGSLSLNVNDLLKSGRYRYNLTSAGSDITGYFQSETRYAYLTFQYKFSKGWQGDGKKRTKKNTKDSRMDFNNSGGGIGTGK